MNANTERPDLGLSGFSGAAEGFLVAPGGPPQVSGSPGQAAMQSKLIPRIYERLWRPVLFTALAAGRPAAASPRQIAASLGLGGDMRVLDVACGPGNTTRPLLDQLGPDATVVGLDASPTMLAQGVRDTHDVRARFVLGDAAALPFPDDSFDVVTCLAALHLMDDPHAVIGELVRVTAPGGRVALLTSCERGPEPLRGPISSVTGLTGIELFDEHELRDRLALLGLVDIHQQRQGFFQLLIASRPETDRG